MIRPLTHQPCDRLLIDASLWSADLGALAADVERVTPWADLLHVDVSDTKFTPEPLFFPDLVRVVRRHTTLPIHVHLMAEHPARLVSPFVDAGADVITVHAEAIGVDAGIAAVRRAGVSLGLAVGLPMPVDLAVGLAVEADLVVMIGTRLGTKGTGMDPHAPARLAEMRRLLSERAVSVPVFADGGIRADTVSQLVTAGATGVVAGSLLFAAEDPATVADWLRRLPLSLSAVSR